MELTIKSGLRHLVEGMRAYFADRFEEGVRPVVACGWRQRNWQVNQGPGRANRVVVFPGSLSGAGGKLLNVRRAGPREIAGDEPGRPAGHIRPLREWDRVIGISVWAYDGSARTDELVQADAAEALFEEVVRAIHTTAFATAIMSDVQWTVPTERSFGQEILVGLLRRTPLFGLPTETAFPDPVVMKEPPPQEESP
jgi:hypothetical protein